MVTAGRGAALLTQRFAGWAASVWAPLARACWICSDLWTFSSIGWLFSGMHRWLAVRTVQSAVKRCFFVEWTGAGVSRVLAPVADVNTCSLYISLL